MTEAYGYDAEDSEAYDSSEKEAMTEAEYLKRTNYIG
jgi:hypothetical protein